MVTVLFYMTVKPGREDDFRELARWLTDSTRAEDAGCLAYTYYRQADNPRECILYEQWEDEAALVAHLDRLVAVYGAPPPGAGLPAALLDYFEATRAVRYEVVV